MRGHHHVRMPAVTAALCFVALAVLLAAPALSLAAVPPQGEAVWNSLPSGLSLILGAERYIGTCKGPSGSVYVVGSEPGPPRAVVVSRVRVASGTDLGGWSYPSTGLGFRPRAVASDARRDLYVTGERDGGDWLTVKFSAAGGILWKQPYASGAGSGYHPDAIALDRAGNVVVSGTVAGPGGYDAVIVKYSSKGALKWKRTLSTKGRDRLAAIDFDEADNVYLSGSKRDAGATPGIGIVRSYAPGGRFRWERALGLVGKSTQFQQIRVKGTTVTVAGTAGSASGARLIAARYRTNSVGTKVWGLRWITGYPGGSWVGGLAVDGGGNAVISGVAYDLGSSALDTPLVWKLKGSSGVTLWTTEFANPAWPHDGRFDSVALDSSGRVYAGGDVHVTGSTASCLLVRFSAGGVAQGMWRSDGPASGTCTFDQVLVLSDTTVLAGGLVTGGSGPLAAIYRANTTLP